MHTLTYKIYINGLKCSFVSHGYALLIMFALYSIKMLLVLLKARVINISDIIVVVVVEKLRKQRRKSVYVNMSM